MTTEKASEPAQPVAWRSWTGQCGYGYWESQTDADLHSDPDYRPVPLYTADAIRAAVEAEREACALVCESMAGVRGTGKWSVLITAAAAIRNRSVQDPNDTAIHKRGAT